MEEDGVAMMVVGFSASCAAAVAAEMVDSKLVRCCVAMVVVSATVMTHSRSQLRGEDGGGAARRIWIRGWLQERHIGAMAAQSC